MKLRIGLDQTTAWLFALLFSVIVFSCAYVFLSRWAERQRQHMEVSESAPPPGEEKEKGEKGEKEEKGEMEEKGAELKEKEKEKEKEEESEKHSEHGEHGEKGEHEEKHGEKHSSEGAGHGAKNAPWSYDGRTGPEFWADLSDAYTACQLGRKQSPIDIKDAAGSHELRPLKFFYKSVDLQLENNGHTILAHEPPGSYLLHNGVRYNLLNFQLHLPSEHLVNGVPYDMELQLVHENEDGKKAMVAVFMTEGSQNHLAVEKLWEHLPKKANETSEPQTFNVTELLPTDLNYYAYEGSLSTPPCTEDTTWLVMMEPIKISANEIDRFINIFRNNARPVQPLQGRKIEHSNRS